MQFIPTYSQDNFMADGEIISLAVISIRIEKHYTDATKSTYATEVLRLAWYSGPPYYHEYANSFDMYNESPDEPYTVTPADPEHDLPPCISHEHDASIYCPPYKTEITAGASTWGAAYSRENDAEQTRIQLP